MSKSHRMRWRPALGVMALGAIAVGLGIQGASAEKARTARKGEPSGPASIVQQRSSRTEAPVPMRRQDVATSVPAAKKAQAPDMLVPAPGTPAAEHGWSWQPADELHGFTEEAVGFGQASGFHSVDADGKTATGTNGACCLAGPCNCVPNQSEAACIAASGVWQGAKTFCANDICGCLSRACCSPAGVCLSDLPRAACEGGGNTWHIEASCTGAGGLPLPVCNAYDVNSCSWDNGMPLNDGGASRSHVHSAGGGQLPRYDFGSADDFILRGPDSTPCQIDLVTVYMRARPADTTGPIFNPPTPETDFVGMNVTIGCNMTSNVTGFDRPGFQGNVPADGDDLNPKVAVSDGGLVYARTYFNADANGATYTFVPGICDPPPASGLETESVWKIDIVLDPPVHLNKNKKYWLDVQGLFPFNDGLRETLQSWWMPSQRNTGLRGMTQRTGNADYTPDVLVNGVTVPCTMNSQCAAFPGGFCHTSLVCKAFEWAPNNVDLVPPNGSSPVQVGNAGNCPGAPTARTRLDFAFQLSGFKEAGPKPGDLCVNADEIFDGATPYDNTGAGTDGAAGSALGDCPGKVLGNDLWWRYTATCTGVLTVTTCGSAGDSVVQVYDGQACPGAGLELDCDNSGCTGDDGFAEAAVTDTGLYLIRVSSNMGNVGKGVVTVDCQDVCGLDDGNVLVNNCCVAHDPELGCEDQDCCENVCSIPAEVGCCNDFAIGWDSECAGVAALLPKCNCPCAFTCPGGSTLELEACGANTNGGCNNPPATPETFEGPYALTLGVQRSFCGTTRAEGNTRDTDWWQISIPATGTGFASTEVIVDGSASIGLIVLGREEPPNPDPDSAETYCLDSVCSGGTACQAAAGCIENDPGDDGDDEGCPVGETCEQVGAAMLQFGTIATASCAATDGMPGPFGPHCDPLRMCLPDDSTYLFVLVAAEALEDCGFGDGIFNNLPCGGADDYGFRVTATDGCGNGACCLCNGMCDDTLDQYECFLAGGLDFFGEGSLCTDPDVTCTANPCSTPAPILCGQTVIVDLTGEDTPPALAYPCGAAGNDPPDVAFLKFTAPCVDDDGDATATCSALGVCPAGGIPCNPGSPCGADDCNDEAGVDRTSALVKTCDTVSPLLGRDSLVMILGSCCTGGMCPGGAECDSGSFCGSSCCDVNRPLTPSGCSDDACGFTDFMSSVCDQNLIEGEMYLIQISSWNADVTNATFELDLVCPCLGSCCDPDTAICTDNTPADNCLEADGLSFSTEFTCATLTPPCGQGACCMPNGACSDTNSATCLAMGGNPNPGAACSAIVCNPYDGDQCDYITGQIPQDEGTFGFRSQYRPDNGLWTEIADDFELKDIKIACSVDEDCPGTACVGGDGVPGLPDNGVCAHDNNCLVSDIIYVTFHTNHDTDNGCEQGGLGTCADDPSEYEGIIVTISNDETGDEKGPTCQPDCDGVNCFGPPTYHTGAGCKYSVAFGMAAGDPPPTSGNYWTYEIDAEGGQRDYHIRLHFDPPLSLAKNKKNWLAISAVLDQVGFYSVIWFATGNWNGNPSQAYTVDAQEFAPLAFPNDQLFQIIGTKETFGCGPCQLYGDHVGDFCTVDVGDLLCVLDRFAGEGACGATCTSCDQAPCGGDGFDDVGDILAELDAFSGIPLCEDPCPPGGCILPDTSCIDGFTPGGGSSETSCQQAGGSYCGDYTLCGVDCP